ncbi:MAG: DUF6159 family protein, partial [Bacteroidota bacterium]
MKFFDRLSNGWNLGIKSLEVIGSHPKLLLFPVLSGLAMIAVVLSFGGAFLGLAGFDPEAMEAIFGRMEQMGEVVFWAITFVFYLITYFVIVFFNVALVHNVRLIFAGEEPSIREGISFSAQRAPQILAWAAVAATVGLIIKAIEDRLGSLVSGIIGFAWSMATYFVVPTLAAEDIGPIEALKRSSATIRERWGDAIGAGFSLGLFVLAGIAISIVTGFVFGYLIHPGLGVFLGFLTFMLTLVVNGAARNVFLTAAYEHTQGNTPDAFDAETLDGIFMPK